MANGLGCGIERTATEQKMAFHSIVRNTLGVDSEETEDLLMDIQRNISDMIDEYQETHDETDDPFVLDKATLDKVLTESEVPEDKVAKIEKSLEDVFGEKEIPAENVIDSKSLIANEARMEKIALENQVGALTLQLDEKNEQLEERTNQLIEKQEEIDNYIAETKTYDVVLRVKPEKASKIKSSIIDGQKCLVSQWKKTKTLQLMVKYLFSTSLQKRTEKLNFPVLIFLHFTNKELRLHLPLLVP